MPRARRFQLFVSCLGSYVALAVTLGALAWQALLIEALPVVYLPSWDADAAPLVVVDAGHGGHDGGAVANGVIEKDLSLNLARQVKAHLEKAGVRVRMTREKDRFLELDERCQVATETKADAFVSVHLNTSPAKEIQGIETYYATASTLMARAVKSAAGAASDRLSGEALARTIQRHASTGTKAEDRGIKDSQLIVVMRTPCPAALVECGFLTHPEEVKKLQQKAYQERLTRGIADGVTEFLKCSVQAHAKPRMKVAAH
ncbi:MAG: N-acetylmuramoyl-L-alanine amidase [Verrucomicrobiota bacterium]